MDLSVQAKEAGRGTFLSVYRRTRLGSDEDDVLETRRRCVMVNVGDLGAARWGKKRGR